VSVGDDDRDDGEALVGEDLLLAFDFDDDIRAHSECTSCSTFPILITCGLGNMDVAMVEVSSVVREGNDSHSGRSVVRAKGRCSVLASSWRVHFESYFHGGATGAVVARPDDG
jgi:hypothetical protein